MGSNMLVEFLDFRTASRSTTARPDSRPAPRIETVGSTTPAGRLGPASYAKYEVTSSSVTIVRTGLLTGFSATCLIAATFFLRSSASFFVGRAPAARVAAAKRQRS